MKDTHHVFNHFAHLRELLGLFFFSCLAVFLKEAALEKGVATLIALRMILG